MTLKSIILEFSSIMYLTLAEGPLIVFRPGLAGGEGVEWAED